MWYEKLKFLRPATLPEALDLLSQTAAQPIAGGTDLLVQLRQERRTVTGFINIADLPELKQLNITEHRLQIGAGVTFNQYLSEAATVFTPLSEAVAQIASPSVRNRATFGGNIVNASPAADTLPLLYALDAELTLRSAKGQRKISVHDFIIGPKRTKLRSAEILTQIEFEIPERYTYLYRKIGPRRAMALSKVSFFGLFLPVSNAIRIAYGAVGPTVIRAYSAEKLFKEGNIEGIPALIEETVRPISDQRSTAEYRRYLCRRLTEAFLRQIVQRPVEV